MKDLSVPAPVQYPLRICIRTGRTHIEPVILPFRRNLDFSTWYVIVKVVEPRIIPRKEHGISRKQISPNAVRTLYRLHSKGFIAHLVGGCVRDLLLGRTPKDFDIATDATPGQIKRLFHNCRIIGRRFRLAHLHFQNEIVEVATFRRTGNPSDNLEETDQMHRFPRHAKDEDGMVLADNVFGTPAEDALRRDFTVNALAYNIADFSVIDYSTGLNDLNLRLIRPIGDPRVQFTEDPVRMLRALRFAASLGFAIEPSAWECLRDLSATISRASPARLYEEVQKLFLLGCAQSTFHLMEKSGLLITLFPTLGRWVYRNNHRLTLMNTNLWCLDQQSHDQEPLPPALLLAALFGPSLEEAALTRHLEGIPLHQALDETCQQFMRETSETVRIPGRVAGRIRAILALQPSLRRMPARRPSSVVARLEFGDALAYLRLAAQSTAEYRFSLEWWEAFLAKGSSAPPFETPTDDDHPKSRRKRRRKRRPAGKKSPAPSV
jgi:poly(A) polymerase